MTILPPDTVLQYNDHMKRIFLSLFVLLAFALTGLGAASVTLGWDPNPEPDIAGYRIYWRTNGGAYLTNRFVAVTNGTTGTVTNLSLGLTYRFVATAYNTSGLESDYSNEVTAIIPGKPIPPQNLHTNAVILKAMIMGTDRIGGEWALVHSYEDLVITNLAESAFYKTKLAIAHSREEDPARAVTGDFLWLEDYWPLSLPPPLPLSTRR